MKTRAKIRCAVYALRGAWLFLLFGFARLDAHPANLTSAVATIRRDGHFEVALTFDVLAFALNDRAERVPDADMTALLNGPSSELERRLANARRHFLLHFRVLADSHEVPFQLQRFPSAEDILRWKVADRTVLFPVLMSCASEGQLPLGTHEVVFQFPDIIGNVVFTVERPGEEPTVESVESGRTSRPQALSFSRPAGGSAEAAAGGEQARKAEAVSDISLHTKLVTTWRFLGVGFSHILPGGWDHVLFVLGLFLLAGRISSLLWQVTAFTLAHSLTLGLSLYGIVQLPASIVEPLIALSIALVAFDNLRGGELRSWRIFVVFAFGLVHGLGFAGALREVGLPRGDFLPALIGFNAGVEVGQLTVIAGAFMCVGWLRAKPSYRRWIVTPASITIGLVAVVWTVQRLGLFV